MRSCRRTRRRSSSAKSGVGKSSMVNMLVGEDIQDTTPVRNRDGKGRHTTVSREMGRYPAGRLDCRHAGRARSGDVGGRCGHRRSVRRCGGFGRALPASGTVGTRTSRAAPCGLRSRREALRPSGSLRTAFLNKRRRKCANAARRRVGCAARRRATSVRSPSARASPVGNGDAETSSFRTRICYTCERLRSCSDERSFAFAPLGPAYAT